MSRSGQLARTASTDWSPDTPWRVFGRFALVYVHAGGGIYEDAHGLQQPITAGDAILVFPSLAHRYGPAHRGQMWQEVYFVFEGPAFDAWLTHKLLDEHRPVAHLSPIDVWRHRIVSIVDPVPAMTTPGRWAEACRVQLLLADILTATQPRPEAHCELADARDARWLAEARRLLEEGLSAQEAARRLHCAYATFRRRFTTLTSTSPARYQAAHRIEQACHLMHTTDWRDKQIAHHLGFADEFHFSRRFKALMGLSPRAYRHQLP